MSEPEYLINCLFKKLKLGEVTLPIENERWLLRFVEKTDSLLIAKDGVAFNGYWIFK